MDIINAVQSHGIVAAGASFAVGVACANVPAIIRLLVGSKVVTAMIRKDPALAKAIVAELQKDVDAVADTPAP